MGIKYQVNEEFFNIWTPKMAYALGFIYADGSLEDSPYLRGQYLRITSTDKDVLETIKQWLSSEHKIIKKKIIWKNGKQVYLLRIGSHKIFASLIKFGLYPRKSLTITLPIVPKDYLSHFIRGYFDGDGCVSLAMSKNNNDIKRVRKMTTSFTSGSKTFLEELAVILAKNVNIRVHKVYESHRSYQLCYGTVASTLIFKLIYADATKSFFFRRKAEKFKKYFEIYPARVDQDTQQILECLDTAMW